MSVRLARAAAWLVPLGLFAYLFLITLNLSLNDPDLFWHLKTGDYIIENWEVPDVDPFAYTTPRPLSLSQKIGLRSQWLGQVVFALANLMGGLYGVLIFRNILILLPPLILFVWLVRRGAGPLGATAVVSFAASLFAMQLFYSFERPQGISFAFSILLFIFLDRLREDARTPGFHHSYWLLPLLMALWSNIHAGFIVGNVVIGLYALGEGLTRGLRALRKRAEAFERPVFFVVLGAAVLATMLNPNTYHLFYSYLSGMVSMFFTQMTQSISGQGGSWVRDVVLEFKPLYYFYAELNYKWLVFYWIFTGLLYAVLALKYLLKRRVDLAELLSLSLVVFFANYHARGLMFSLAVMPYVMGNSIVQLSALPGKERLLRRAAVGVMIALTAAFGSFMYKTAPFMLAPRLEVVRAPISPWYPESLVAFMRDLRKDGMALKPPMYNYYTWGGYLIWALYPDYQVYIDGRAIDDMINRTADDILKLQGDWESKLGAYGINFIVTPLIFRESGHVIPLAPGLALSDKWKLVFLRNNAAIFVRDTAENREVIFKFNMEKNRVFHEILEVENILLAAAPYNPTYHIARSDALYYLGRYDEARKILEQFPNRPEARARLMLLKGIGH
jgi:hypothetical protein